MTSSPTLSISSMLIDKANQYYLPIYRPRETVMERGSGAKLWDKSGKEYIDFAAGIAVCSLGHANPELVKVLTDQANKLWHVSNGFYSEPPILLVEKLVQLSGFAKRGGNGTICPKASCTFCGKPFSIGVSIMPGAMTMTRIAWRANSRAIGKVMATTAPFEAE